MSRRNVLSFASRTQAAQSLTSPDVPGHPLDQPRQVTGNGGGITSVTNVRLASPTQPVTSQQPAVGNTSPETWNPRSPYPSGIKAVIGDAGPSIRWPSISNFPGVKRYQAHLKSPYPPPGHRCSSSAGIAPESLHMWTLVDNASLPNQPPLPCPDGTFPGGTFPPGWVIGQRSGLTTCGSPFGSPLAATLESDASERNTIASSTFR